MSKPKNMTPEQEAAWNEKERARCKAYYEANQEKVKASAKADVEKLTPAYVANQLCMKLSEIPTELLELKREQLAITREIRKLTKQIDQTNQEQNHE